MDTDNQQADLQNKAPAGMPQAGQQQSKEVIKRKTKRHEYVEVDGFHFRRKRRPPATPLASAAAANSAAAVAAAGGQIEPRSSSKDFAAVKQGLQLDDAAQPSPAKPAEADAAQAADLSQQDQDHQDADMADAAAEQQEQDQSDADGEPAAEFTVDAPSAASQQAAAAAAAAAAEAAELAAAAASAAAAAAAAEAAAQAAAADCDIVEATDDAADGEQQPAGPLQFTMLPSELCHLMAAFFATEMQKLPGFDATTAQQAAEDLKQQLQQQLPQQGAAQAGAAGSRKEGEQAGTSAGSALPPLTVLPYQVEELKAKLLDKHNKLVQEQEAWMQLLSQYNAMAGTAPAAAGAEGQPTPSAASPLPASAEQQGPNTAPTPGPAEAGAPAEGSTPGAAGGAAGTPGAGTGPGTVHKKQGAEVEAEGAGSDADAGASCGEAEGPVCAEQQESLLGVQLKVEVLTALVTKMEHLVARAEATARALQAGYRAEKFSIFPHVDSPAVLIKSLAAKSSQATQGSQGSK